MAILKQLSSFMVLNVGGGDRISFRYDEIDSNTGDFVSRNKKENFNVVGNDLKNHVAAIRDYIITNKLGE